MKPICADTSDLEAILKAGPLYVDKTAYFHRPIYSIGFSFDSKTRQLVDSAVVNNGGT